MLKRAVVRFAGEACVQWVVLVGAAGDGWARLVVEGFTIVSIVESYSDDLVLLSCRTVSYSCVNVNTALNTLQTTCVHAATADHHATATHLLISALMLTLTITRGRKDDKKKLENKQGYDCRAGNYCIPLSIALGDGGPARVTRSDAHGAPG